jgi:RNA polymerase sigma factor (sigma-70 family)
MTSPAQEGLQLTPDLLEYAKAVALIEAQKHCGRRLHYDDAIQEAEMALWKSASRYNPARGASVKTFIYTIVQRAVIKFATREGRKVRRLKVFPKPPRASDETGADEDAQLPLPHRIADERAREWAYTLDDILRYIDCEESRALCRLVVECKGSTRAAARHMGVVEGTVRYRLRLLAPRLIAAGFNPFKREM